MCHNEAVSPPTHPHAHQIVNTTILEGYKTLFLF